jgi:microsomal dipeptidase-like Zn-dependent dipeptidase
MTPTLTTQAAPWRELTVIDALDFNTFDRERLETMIANGITCTQVTCAVWEDALAAMRNMRRWEHLIEDNADLALQVLSADDIRLAKQHGKLGLMLGFQNSSPLGGDVDMVEAFYRLGIRVMQLTYNNQSLVASGCYEDSDAGVTRFGREVIREMNRTGMLIDLSHVGDRSSYEAIEASERPVAITHANPKWFNDVGRNKGDKVLSALSERGGVIGVSTFAMLMPGGTPEMMKTSVTIEDFCAMIGRLVEQVGINHVGVGLDTGETRTRDYILWCRMGTWTREAPPTAYGEKPTWATGPSWQQLGRIWSALRQTGFNGEEIAAIMGGNWLRLFDNGFRPLA